jgi:hypothetical protein
LVIFSHASFKTVGTVIVFSSFSPPFLPLLLVKFRPYFVHFISSDFYGAGPFATAHHWRMLIIGEWSPLCLSTMDEATTEEDATMAEVTNEQQTNAEVPDATIFTLYIPEFVQGCSLSGKTPDEQNTELLHKDWLTPGLISVSFMKSKLCSLSLLRSTVTMTTSMTQWPSNAR